MYFQHKIFWTICGPECEELYAALRSQVSVDVAAAVSGRVPGEHALYSNTLPSVGSVHTKDSVSTVLSGRVNHNTRLAYRTSLTIAL